MRKSTGLKDVYDAEIHEGDVVVHLVAPLKQRKLIVFSRPEGGVYANPTGKGEFPSLSLSAYPSHKFKIVEL